MESYQLDHLNITLNKEGARQFTKVSFPIRYGRFSEIKTPDYIFQFNLNGEIKFIEGIDRSWPANEWLKRTITNDWTYYSAGGYNRFYSFLGEYYLPCFSYPSNSIIGSDPADSNPFDTDEVKDALKAWKELPAMIKGLNLDGMPQNLKDFMMHVSQNDNRNLWLKAYQFHKLIGGRITVLPPDSRHVDYEVIPIIIADGCIYNCGFCRVKSGQDFTPRTQENIIEQMKNLKAFYGRDLHNYNSVFLGQHDALYADPELIVFAAENAYEIFEFKQSNVNGAKLFLFGSVDSMLKAKEQLFESLNRLPFYTYINLGLESGDQATLDFLKKPVTVEKVNKAFFRMLDINKKYQNIEVTANFLLGGNLPERHVPSVLKLTRDKLDHAYGKGAIYISSLNDGGGKKEMQSTFVKIKNMSRLPTFLYLIQRL